MKAYLKNLWAGFCHRVSLGNRLLVILLLCGSAGAQVVDSIDAIPSAKAVDPNEKKIRNPHWQSNDCRICHQDDQETFTPIAHDKVDALCLSCHDGQNASSETHPTGRTLQSNADYKQPENWPLVEGKLSCITCHDVTRACQEGLSRSMVNPMFLRDRWVGNKEKFCQNCHVASSYKRLVPHIMIVGSRDIIQLGEPYRIDEAACLFCHQELQDRSTMKRTGEPHLRATQQVLCKVCHRTHKKFYEPGHMRSKIPEDMQAFMYSRELLGPNAKPGGSLIARLRKAGAKPTRMVPDATGRITCSTCHNPHQENVFPPGSELSHDPMWLVGPAKVTSPSTTKKVCADCHN